MAVTTRSTSDVSQALAMALSDIAGLRVVWWVADTARPPVCVIGLPTIDYVDNVGGFCFAVWDYPLTIVAARNNDRDAQTELSRFVSDVALALDAAEPEAVDSIEPTEARPISVTVNGQDLPAYELRVRVRA